MSIPKIIHQLWIGEKPAPIHMMNTWKYKHPDFEYIFWNEYEIETKMPHLSLKKQIHWMNEINGKADIIRWEILYHFGGIFIDADSICIEPLDSFFLEKTAFASFENEILREGLIATGTMGFIPRHPLCKAIIEEIQKMTMTDLTKYRAWYSVGPALLTKMLNTGKFPDFSVFPSYMFLPVHFTEKQGYLGHKKVYAYQEWSTAKNNYSLIHTIELPFILREPVEWVSVLISSFNTDFHYISECLASIRNQSGHFGMEIVWINDGSDEKHTALLERALDNFIRTSRWVKLVYRAFPDNCGTRVSLQLGVLLCSHELIFKMDSDDIMLPRRIQCQLDFMKANHECVICGTNMILFSLDEFKQALDQTHHPAVLTWEEFCEKPREWFMNHPTLCYRKSAVLEVGNYNLSDQHPSFKEDFELEIRFLKHFGKIHNISENLLYYRIHSKQVSYKRGGVYPSFPNEN